METPFDWITVAIFAGIVVIFLQRSMSEAEAQDSIWSYMPPSIGCAIANYLGNEGYPLPAVALITAVLAYCYFVIKPFQRG